MSLRKIVEMELADARAEGRGEVVEVLERLLDADDMEKERDLDRNFAEVASRGLAGL